MALASLRVYGRYSKWALYIRCVVQFPEFASHLIRLSKSRPGVVHLFARHHNYRLIPNICRIVFRGAWLAGRYPSCAIRHLYVKYLNFAMDVDSQLSVTAGRPVLAKIADISSRGIAFLVVCKLQLYVNYVLSDVSPTKVIFYAAGPRISKCTYSTFLNSLPVCRRRRHCFRQKFWHNSWRNDYLLAVSGVATSQFNVLIRNRFFKWIRVGPSSIGSAQH